MNLVGRVAQVWMPEPVRKALLRRLFAVTAGAFDRPAPPLRGLSAPQTLHLLRDFTAQVATEVPVPSAVSDRLFAGAFAEGRRLRRLFGVSSVCDVMSAARTVYRAIDIDFRGDHCGRITVSHCFFSAAYTPGACQLMSALDAGLLGGLSGGGRLVFSQRITEGHPCCNARLVTS